MSVRSRPNDLEAFWMPFTANRQFKKAPRLFVGAERMHYTTDDGRRVLDGTSGLWCVNAGHCRPKIVEAIRKQAGELDFAGTFQMGHPQGVRGRLEARQRSPRRASTTCSSPTRAPSRSRPRSRWRSPITGPRATRTKVRLIGRERGYHGVNFGGTSVGGIANNRKMFGTLLSRRRPSSPHPRSRPQRLQPRRARAWRRARRRSRAARRAARRLDHRRRHRRAGRLLDRRADPAQGLSEASRRDLRQARHPADLR